MSNSGDQRERNDGEDLYLVLGVARGASAAELKSSFHKLSQRFHPDKHQNEQAKVTATNHFTRVKEAYEILSNDKLRRIYEEFGLDAARAAATPEMELVPYSDLADRFRNNAPGGGRHSSGGHDGARDAYFTVANALEPRIDATGLVVALEDGELPYSGDVLAITQVNLSAMATAYLSPNNTLAIRYSLAGHGHRSHGDAGVGDAVLSFRRQIDPYMHAEATATVPLEPGSSLSVATKVFRSLSNDMSASWEANYDPENGAFTSALSSARSFNERCTASVSWAMGARSGYVFSWTRSAYDEYLPEKSTEEDTADAVVAIGEAKGMVKVIFEKLGYFLEPFGFRCTARWSIMDASVGIVLRRPIGESAPLIEKCEPTGSATTYLKINALAGVIGWEARAGVGRRYMSADTEVSTSIGVGTIGIIWRVKVRRGAHRFSLPIVLQSGLVDARTATLAAIWSSVAVSAFEVFVLQPWQERQERKAREEAKARRAEVLEQGRAEAQASLELMAAQVEKSRNAESEVVVDGNTGSGLLIERAVYGVSRKVRKMGFSHDIVTGRETEEEVTEVTEAVQALVENSVVQVVSATKSTLMGFWDPSAFGDKEDLILRIWYLFRGEKHECLLKDDETIELPLSSHRTSEW